MSHMAKASYAKSMRYSVVVSVVLFLSLFCTAYTILRFSRGPDNTSTEPYFVSSTGYDWGWHGVSPRQRYRSFKEESPKFNLMRRDEGCNDGLIFLQTRRKHHYSPLMIMDQGGNLVWMPTEWNYGRVSDVKVQQFQARNYMTFLSRTAENRASSGPFVLLDDKYQFFRQIQPVGNFSSNLQGLQLTEDGTAIIHFRHKLPVPESDSAGKGSMFEPSVAVFQEIDLDSSSLLFEWRATQQCPQLSPDGIHPLYINSVSKAPDGGYILSTRCSNEFAVSYISNQTGKMICSLGGLANDSQVLTEAKSHHALPLVDQPSLQVLPDRHVLIGSDLIPAFQEVVGSRILCDTRVAPIWLSIMGWLAGMAWLRTQSVAIYKFDWMGRPDTRPDVFVDRNEGAVYISWNGATDIDAWVLQSRPEGDSTTWIEHVRVPRTQFETRVSIPSDSKEILRVVALDRTWKVAAYSAAWKQTARPAVVSSRLLHADQQAKSITFWAILCWATVVAGIYSHQTKHKRVCLERGAQESVFKREVV